MRIVLVECRDYNGHKNCLFIMRTDDDRLGNDNWHFLSCGRRVGDQYHASNGGVYEVFSDWSVRRLPS